MSATYYSVEVRRGDNRSSYGPYCSGNKAREMFSVHQEYLELGFNDAVALIHGQFSLGSVLRQKWATVLDGSL